MLSLKTLLLFTSYVIVVSGEALSWFDQVVEPYEKAGDFDACVFTYFSKNSSTLVHSVRGKCYDLNGKETGDINPDTTLLRIGSVTKLFTGAAIYQLCEAGVVNLEDPVVKHVPALAKHLGSTNVTVLDTLRHTGGYDERRLDIVIPGRLGMNETMIDAAVNLYTEQLVAPGKRFSYSNYGVILAGAVVEGASNMPLIQYFRKHIGAPLNISDMYFHTDLAGDFSRCCYSRQSIPYEPFQVRATASGDLYITSSGVAKFLRAIMNNGAGLFKDPESAKGMYAWVYPKDFDGRSAVFFRESYRNQTIVHHGGSVIYYLSMATFFQELGEGFLFFHHGTESFTSFSWGSDEVSVGERPCAKFFSSRVCPSRRYRLQLDAHPRQLLWSASRP
jgi:CubicO group peptidase (beta-lactamase class C family)